MITSLHTGQTQFFYAHSGTVLYLLSGATHVMQIARWSGLPIYENDLPLQEGGSLLLPQDGWILIRAQQPSELRCVEPQTLGGRFLVWLQGVIRQRLGGLILSSK